jgi:tRNA(Ile)-lysidine synthase
MSAEVPQAGTIASGLSSVTAVVSREEVAGGLTVRNRRPGDRFMPSAAGHRKLQDLLVDRKVPRAERDRIPVVVDAAGRIVWVVGHALDQAFRVSDPAQAVVVLRLKGVGGSC